METELKKSEQLAHLYRTENSDKEKIECLSVNGEAYILAYSNGGTYFIPLKNISYFKEFGPDATLLLMNHGSEIKLLFPFNQVIKCINHIV